MHRTWLTAVLLILGCASEPWANVSQSEIDAWKKLGYDSEQAQKMGDESISPAVASEWADAGLVGWDAIEPWSEKGFSPSQAGAWKQADCDADEASSWSEKKFTPIEAAEWKDGGFSLSMAEKARAPPAAP